MPPRHATALTDTDPVGRELALGALLRLDQLSDDDLRGALADERAAGAPTSGDDRRQATAHLVARNCSTTPDPTVVEAAAWACGEQERVDDDVLAALVDLGVTSTDALVREACVAALGAIGDVRGLPTILRGCTDKPAVRRRAVLALAPFDGDEVERRAAGRPRRSRLAGPPSGRRRPPRRGRLRILRDGPHDMGSHETLGLTR